MARKTVPPVPPEAAKSAEPILRQIPLELLRLDLENPRLPMGRRNKGQAAALDYLVQNGNVIEIMESIAHNDFFSGERLLVAPSITESGNYTVVEGNCRLAACMLLVNPSLARSKPKAVMDVSASAKYKPKELPCLLFESRNIILPQLGFRHITGVTEWSPLQKARYFNQIRFDRKLGADYESYRTMAMEFGSAQRWDYVAGSLTTLKLFEKIQEGNFFNIRGLSEDSLSFSVLSTALSYEKIVKFLDLKDRRDEAGAEAVKIDRLEELTRWLFEITETGRPRVAESRQLKALAEVVGNERALKAFRNGKSLDIAQKMTDLPQQTVMKLLSEAKSKIEAAYDIAKEASFGREDIKYVEDISAQNLRSLRDVMAGRIDRNDPFDLSGEDE